MMTILVWFQEGQHWANIKTCKYCKRALKSDIVFGSGRRFLILSLSKACKLFCHALNRDEILIDIWHL